MPPDAPRRSSSLTDPYFTNEHTKANRKGGCMRTARLICTETCAASLEHVGEPGCGGLAESRRLREAVVV